MPDVRVVIVNRFVVGWLLFTVNMNGNGNKKADEMLDTSVSNEGEEPTDMNQVLDSHRSQLQHPESGMQDHREHQLQCDSTDTKTMIKEEVGRLLVEEKKSLIDDQRLREELSKMKQQLESDNGSRLDSLRDNLQQQLDTERRDSNFRHQQLETALQTMIKEEVGRLLEEEKKSLIDGQRLHVELSQMKLQLKTDNGSKLDILRDNLQQQLDAEKRDSNSRHQQLETAQRDSSQQLSALRSQLMIMQVLVVCILIAVIAARLAPIDLKRWSRSQQEPAIEEYPPTVAFDKEVALKHFTNGINELQRAFPSQSLRLWRIIESATLPVIEEESPAHPAVILLVAAKGHSAVAECLAQRYAELVTESLNAAAHTAFNCEMDAYSDPDDAKGQVDSELSGAFDAGAKAGLVHRLEKLPGPAAMIFYRFADNDNAPYKNVAIVLTLTLESTDAGSERDNVAYDELRKIWGSSLDVDKVEPLLSRIGNSVAFVRPETTNTLSENDC